MKIALRRIAPTSGYGNVAEGVERGLKKLGIQVVDHTESAPVMLHILPPHFLQKKLRGQRLALLTMWESDRCPEGLRAGFPNFEWVFCPTKINLETFSEYHPNVHRLDFGVDWEFWHPPKKRPEPEPFRVLYTAHSPVRKGADLVDRLKPIYQIRSPEQCPVPASSGTSPSTGVLSLRRTGGDTSKIHPSTNIVKETLGRGFPEVQFIPASAGSDEDLRELYWSAHLYIQPSRAEGHGLMPLQALATGMPALVSDVPGHREWAWLPGCVTCNTRVTPSLLTFHGDPGNWWEPDFDDLVGKLTHCVEQYPILLAEAQGAPDYCRARFDWNDVAANIVGIIGEDALNAPDPEPIWEPAEFLDFPVIPTRNLGCDIGLTHYEFRAGEEARVSADVKRVLREAGYLEPDLVPA